jgi:type IV secretion system protein VirD4
MDMDDVRAAGLLERAGVLLGKTLGDQLLRFNEDGHIVVFSPTGGGKGIGFVQANLVDYKGSMIVLDPKGENAIVSATYRRRQGQEVIILDPFNKTGLGSAQYNPLGPISYASREMLGPMIENISDALIPPDFKAENPHWPLGAKRFISFLLWFMVAHVSEEDRNLVKLFEMAYSGYETLSKAAHIMVEGRHPDEDVARMCNTLGNWFLGREEREYGYFESQAQNNLGWVGDAVWSKVLASKPTPPLPLKQREFTIYLVLPFELMNRYRPWLRLMVADLLNCLYVSPGGLDTPVLFMLDEAFSLGGMPSLIDAAAAVRSAGARMCFVYQDMIRPQTMFGDAWGSLLANAGAIMFWAIGLDPKLAMAEFISKAAGYKTVPVPGQPQGVGQLLIRPEQVLQLPSDEIIAFFRNQPPARFGRLHVRQDQWFKDSQGQDILAPNTTRDKADKMVGVKVESVARQAVPVDLQFGLAAQRAKPTSEVGSGKKTEARLLDELSREFGRQIFRKGNAYGYNDEASGKFVVIVEP